MYVCMHSCVLMTNGLFCFAVVDVVLVGSSLKSGGSSSEKASHVVLLAWSLACGTGHAGVYKEVSVCLACGVYVQLQVTVSYLPALQVSRAYFTWMLTDM